MCEAFKPVGWPNQVWREAPAHQRVEDGRKRRLRGRGLRRDALRHSLRHLSAVSLVEIAAGVALRDIGCPHSRLIYAAQLTISLSLLQGLVCDKIERRQSERIAGAGSLSFFML